MNMLQGVLAAKAGFEPQRSNNALLFITGLDGNADDLITLSLATFPLPNITNNPVMVGFLNEKRKFAGLPEFEDLNVTFTDYIDRGTARLLLAWRKKVYNPDDGTVGLKSQYAKNGHIEMYAPNGDDAYTRIYDLEGIWPSNMNPGEIDLAGEEIVKISVTLAIDKARPGKGLSSQG